MADAWSKAERGLQEPLLQEEVKEASPADMRSMLRDVQLFSRRLRLPASKRKKNPPPTDDEWAEAEDLVAAIEAALRNGAVLTRAETREFRGALSTMEAKRNEALHAVQEPPLLQERNLPEREEKHEEQRQAMEMAPPERTATEIALEQDTEREIANLNERTFTVNQIFRDIASLVSDQQEEVDSIESQISTALSRTNKAQRQLISANNKKQAKMRCCFYFAVGLSLLMVIIVLGVIGFENVAGAAVL